MTATFRGDQGTKKLISILKDVRIISSRAVVAERSMQLVVVGEQTEKEMYAKVNELALYQQ
jgi:hypothetical protein